MLLHVLLAAVLGFVLGTFVSFAAATELRDVEKYLLETKRLLIGAFLLLLLYLVLQVDQWIIPTILLIVLLSILVSELWWHSLSFELLYYGFFIVAAALILPFLSQTLFFIVVTLIFLYGFPSACIVHVEFRSTFTLGLSFHPRGIKRKHH